MADKRQDEAPAIARCYIIELDPEVLATRRAALTFTVAVVLWVAAGLLRDWPVDASACGLGLAVLTGVLAQTRNRETEGGE